MLLYSISVPKIITVSPRPGSWKWNRGWCWSILRLGSLRLKLSCSFPFTLFSQGKLRQHKAEAPFCFLLCFFPEGVASGRYPEAAFHNLKSASRQILQIPVYMEQLRSTELPVTKKKNFKILSLGEMAVFDSSLISNYESP